MKSKNAKTKTVMTIARFLEVLSDLSPRAKNKVKKWLMCNGDVETCPITSACKKLTNANFKYDNYEEAAKKIGITRTTAKKIADAADGTMGVLRNKMLVAVGLEPERLR